MRQDKRGTGHPTPSGGRDIPSRFHRGSRGSKPVAPEGAMNWTHIAASNMLEDHAAGLYVDPRKLEAARKLLGR